MSQTITTADWISSTRDRRYLSTYTQPRHGDSPSSPDSTSSRSSSQRRPFVTARDFDLLFTSHAESSPETAPIDVTSSSRASWTTRLRSKPRHGRSAAPSTCDRSVSPARPDSPPPAYIDSLGTFSDELLPAYEDLEDAPPPYSRRATLRMTTMEMPSDRLERVRNANPNPPLDDANSQGQHSMNPAP